MIDVVEPVHTEGILLCNVRFFAPQAGAREFPWPSIDDLMQSVGMDRRMRRLFKADLDGSPWRGFVRMIVTAQGRTLIGQHFVAQGLIDAWAQVGRCRPDLYGIYT
ncbi:hypothetical protein I3A86_25305, partial [Salmonella enterica]|nr:hypothetical protein [Salmonella enterica]